MKNSETNANSKKISQNPQKRDAVGIIIHQYFISCFPQKFMYSHSTLTKRRSSVFKTSLYCVERFPKDLERKDLHNMF